MAGNKPLLSIGMIFKNEIRCLERCLQSLQPLREAVPCELVMADTGSEDGSREVAAKYADILFDFPWVNDFSAARNAVMDRCSGKWYLTIDADEWLEDIEELVRFLRNSASRRVIRAGQAPNYGFVIQRNYLSYSLWDNYSDAYVPRMLRMSTGVRYSGTIHELWRFQNNRKEVILSQTFLHHDGYAGLNANDEIAQAKRKRNMALLREELAQNPEDLRTLSECVDASTGEEKWEYTCRMMELVKQRKPGWQYGGVHCFRSAMDAACNLGRYNELEEWIALAEEMFPQAYVVRLDMEMHAFELSWNKRDYADCARRGKRFLEAYADYHAGRGDQNKYYSLSKTGPRWQSHMQIFLAYVLLKEGEKEKSWETLQNLDISFLDEEETRFLVANLKDLQRLTDYDLEPVLLRLWQKINQPDFARGEDCRKGFTEESLWAFLASNVEKEHQGGVKRPAYTLFLPLGEQNQLGIAAKLMEEKSLPELERLLGLVEDWETLPEMPLLRALAAGANFPVKPLTLTKMDRLAGRLAAESPQMAAEITVKAAERVFSADLQAIMWARGLALAAVQNCDWQEKEALALAQAFAAVEQAFLAQYYTPELLCEENIGLLPPLHAFGWYCAWAFDELAKGNALEYVRLLRKGLDLCPDMKAMVNFLVENTPQLQEKPAPSAELQALAGQVRTILAGYAPDDPAVQAIKSSEVYQKIAYLIEDGEVRDDSEQ